MDIVRAWKDEEYRMSLSPEQRASLPESPVGPIELSDAELGSAGGGAAAAERTYDPAFSFCACYTKSLCSYCETCLP